MNHPQPQILIIWRITLTLVTFIPAFLVSVFLKPGSASWLFSIVLLALVYLFMFLVFTPQLFNNISYSVSRERIIYMTGVLNRRVISAPLSGVQYVSVSQTFLDRLFGLASVVVTLAGGRIIISGLKSSDAEALSELIAGKHPEGGK